MELQLCKLSSAFQEEISNFIQAIHPPLICNEKKKLLQGYY